MSEPKDPGHRESGFQLDPLDDARDGEVTSAVATMLDGLRVPPGPNVAEIRRRARRRRTNRLAATTTALCSIVALSLAAVVISTERITVETGPADAAAPDIRSLTGAPWEWHDDSAIVGRDGSMSGFAMSTVEGSTDLVIVVGDATLCTDASTCSESADHFTSTDLNALLSRRVDDLPPEYMVSPATLLRPGSPFAGMNVAWIPQITGDIALGTLPDGHVDGVNGTQHFVGRLNVEELVARLQQMPFAAGLTNITLVGTGAGGFGALGNYPTIASAFSDQDVSLLVDTAPWFHPGELLRRCRANGLTALWGLKLPPAWPDDLAAGPDAMGNIYRYLADHYPDARLGLMAADDDTVMRGLYRQLSSPCKTATDGDIEVGGPGRSELDERTVTSSAYSAGLATLFSELGELDAWRVLHSRTVPDARPLTRVLTNPRGTDTADIRRFIRDVSHPR